jgi:ribosomal protein L17
MSETQSVPATVQEVEQGWHELNLKVAQLEAASGALENENKALRQLLETIIEHRQKSHSELVILLTNLVSKLPLNDIGAIIAQLLEHDTSVCEFLGGIVKGKVDRKGASRPDVLRTLDQVKRDLAAAIKVGVEELLHCGCPLEPDMLQALTAQPDLFFSPRMVRANRCFVKGQVPKERVLREFGQEALPLFNDMTTDRKLNPRPKQDEILLGFKPDFEPLVKEAAGLTPEKRKALLELYEKVARSKAGDEAGRAERNAFQRLSFGIELLHFYEHQSTEAPDVIFAQRLPALVEQLAVTRPDDYLSVEERMLEQVEALLAHIISHNHRQAVINNLGKATAAGKTLKYILKARSEKPEELDMVIPEMIRHFIPQPPLKPPTAEALSALLRLAPPDAQRIIIHGVLHTERMRKSDAEALAKAVAEQLGLKSATEQKAPDLPPEVERQIAWGKVKDLIARRADAKSVATAIRERLNAKYDAEEIRQSWITLTEADPILIIRVFCQLPYLPSGKTDPIARPVLETYVSRLTHEKYAPTYNKVVNSLKNMFHAKPDSPTLLNFLALVRWVSPESADKVTADIGMQVAAHPA